jgi:hypothetical protein
LPELCEKTKKQDPKQDPSKNKVAKGVGLGGRPDPSWLDPGQPNPGWPDLGQPWVCTQGRSQKILWEGTSQKKFWFFRIFLILLFFKQKTTYKQKK